MKAYKIYDATNDENGCDIVFAQTAKQAKKMTGYTPVEVDNYIDLRAVRYPNFDGLENASELELSDAKWRDGWIWYGHNHLEMPNPETATSKDFIEWYQSQ